MVKIPKVVKSGAKKALGVGRAIKKGVQIGGAAARLVQRIEDPKSQLTFLSGAVRKGEFVLPGTKYIGPGNSLNKGAPVDEADANALQHDKDYDEYLRKGHKAKDVYLGWSDADERLLKKTKATTANGLAVNLGMLAKKGLNKTGLTKRIRDTDKPSSAPPAPAIPSKGGSSAAKSTSSDISGDGRQKQY